MELIGFSSTIASLARTATSGISLIALIACGSLEGNDLPRVETGTAEIAVAKVVPEHGSDFARFGHSVAVDGDVVVVGAWGEEAVGEESGRVHVFERSTEGWRRAAILKASDASAGSRFGYSIDIDGSTIIVGAVYEGSEGRDAGAVYVFVREDSEWVESAKLVPESHTEYAQFGKSVSLSGEFLAIGAPGPGSRSAYIYRRTSDTWQFETELASTRTASGARFGSAVALHGDTVAVGAWTDDMEEPGSVVVYQRRGTSWVEIQHLTGGEPKDRFGFSVALDDEHLVIGAPDSATDMVHLYRYESGTWTGVEASTPQLPWVELGHAVALNSGQVLAGDPAFDGSTAHGGQVLLLATEQSGLSADRFSNPPDVTSGHSFGISLAATEGVTVIGATGDEERGTAAGAVYIFYSVEP